MFAVTQLASARPSVHAIVGSVRSPTYRSLCHARAGTLRFRGVALLLKPCSQLLYLRALRTVIFERPDQRRLRRPSGLLHPDRLINDSIGMVRIWNRRMIRRRAVDVGMRDPVQQDVRHGDRVEQREKPRIRQWLRHGSIRGRAAGGPSNRPVARFARECRRSLCRRAVSARK